MTMMVSATSDVELCMYDFTSGMAASPLSWLLVGKQLDGVWHTSIVVFGEEHYFGRDGIVTSTPGQTYFGHPPEKIETLGRTNKSRESFRSFLTGLKSNKFAEGKYSLLKHNCNTFSNVVSNFLLGRGIPAEILEQPDIIVNGGIERLKQGATIGSLAYSTYQLKQALDSKNKKAETKQDAGPSWLEIGGAVASMATAGIALASFMREENSYQNRNSNALGWRSNNYDSDSD